MLRPLQVLPKAAFNRWQRDSLRVFVYRGRYGDVAALPGPPPGSMYREEHVNLFDASNLMVRLKPALANSSLVIICMNQLTSLVYRLHSRGITYARMHTCWSHLTNTSPRFPHQVRHTHACAEISVENFASGVWRTNSSCRFTMDNLPTTVYDSYGDLSLEYYKVPGFDKA